MVHLLRRGKDLLLAEGLGVAAGHDDAVVIELVVLDAQALCVLAAQSCHHGHDVLQDICPEVGHLLLVVAETAHPVVAQLHEVLVAHLFGHPVPHMDHPVKNVVQLRLVRFQTPAQDLVALLAGLAVRVLGVLHQHGPGQLLALPLKLHGGHQVGILPHQLVLLHHVLNDLVGHGLAGNFHGQHRGEGLFQLRAEGGIQQSRGIVHAVIGDDRADLVIIFVLRHIKGVHGVDGVAHAGKAGVGGKFQLALEVVLPGGEDLLHAFCAADAADHILHHGLHFFQRYPPIGQLGNFHGNALPFSLFAVLLPSLYTRASANAIPDRPSRQPSTTFQRILKLFEIALFRWEKLCYTEPEYKEADPRRKEHGKLE